MDTENVARAFAHSVLNTSKPLYGSDSMLWYVSERSWFFNHQALELFVVLCEMGRIAEVEDYCMAGDWLEFLVDKISQ